MLKYKWCCFKAWFVGKYITDAETGESIYVIWHTRGMTDIPRRGEDFRVSDVVGRCVLRLPGLVVMKVVQ